MKRSHSDTHLDLDMCNLGSLMQKLRWDGSGESCETAPWRVPNVYLFHDLCSKGAHWV